VSVVRETRAVDFAKSAPFFDWRDLWVMIRP
jgi:hypothetical protein